MNLTAVPNRGVGESLIPNGAKYRLEAMEILAGLISALRLSLKVINDQEDVASQHTLRDKIVNYLNTLPVSLFAHRDGSVDQAAEAIRCVFIQILITMRKHLT